MEPQDEFITRSEVGWMVLALFAEGLLRLIGVIPPLLPWLKITLN